MWYYDSQIIKTPKAMVISGITHPKGIFRDSAMLASLGIKPYRETRQDSRYYLDGSYSVDATGDEVVGTYAGTARAVATLNAKMLFKTNSCVANLHANIDWYWTRAAKGGTAVPDAIATYATALYSEHETIKTAIAACNTLAKIIAYENKAHTETRKDEVLDGDGNFASWHASNTNTVARHIDMCTHFTAHPNTPTDAGFVSLSAD
jgi:hypothetical protein